MENLLQSSETRKKVDVIILVSANIDLKLKQIKREKDIWTTICKWEEKMGTHLIQDSRALWSCMHPPPSTLEEINNKHL